MHSIAMVSNLRFDHFVFDSFRSNSAGVPKRSFQLHRWQQFSIFFSFVYLRRWGLRVARRGAAWRGVARRSPVAGRGPRQVTKNVNREMSITFVTFVTFVTRRGVRNVRNVRNGRNVRRLRFVTFDVIVMFATIRNLRNARNSRNAP